MTDFSTSSHAKKWLYSYDQLDHLKLPALQAIPELSTERIQYFLQYEEIGIEYFSQQIWVIFGFVPGSKALLKRKWRVPATAIMYLRRFYLKESMLQHDPRLVMLAAIYLSAKIEEQFIHLSEVMQIAMHYTEEKVLDMERIMLEKLDFDLKIHHPQNEVHGLLTEFRNYLTQNQIHNNHISNTTRDWNVAIDRVLQELQITKVILCCKPLHIAIFAMKATVPAELSSHLDKFIVAQNMGNLILIGTTIHSITQYSTSSHTNSLSQFMDELKISKKWTK